MSLIEYIKQQQEQNVFVEEQRLLEEKRQLDIEEERQRAIEEEAARIAKMEAEARERAEIAARKKLLREQQEAERLRQKSAQRKAKLREQKWNKQRDILLTQINDLLQKDDKLEEIRIIIQNRDPSLQQLDWVSWLLSDPLNQRLADLDLELAMATYKRDNQLAKRRRGTRGKKVEKVNYALSFTGNDDTGARADMVATSFTPNDPTNKGFDEDSGRKPLAESGFTISFWWRPDENYQDSFPIGWKRDNNSRFSFGIRNASKPYWNVGGEEVKNTTWADHFDNSGNSNLKNTLLHDENTNGAPGSGNHLIMGNWYHMVFTYAGTDNVDGDGNMLRKVYLNGYHIYGGFGEGKQSVNWTSHTGAQMTQGLSFGMRAVVGSGNHTDGLRHTKYNNGNECALSEIAIYNEEKNAAWVTAVYDGGSGYNHKDSGGDGLVAYWKLDEGEGTTAKDLGPYGWHGTLTNASHGTKIDTGINALPPSGTPTWETHPRGYDH